MDQTCKEVDQASAALVMDLKQRGLLEDTLVIWGGEFGRTPMGEPRETTRRDHHIDAFMRYINLTLGIPVTPYQYVGGVRYDAKVLSGADNSHYVSATGILAFGDGGVDDSEDPDVVIHELGHGLHDWLTSGGLSQTQGLSEGLGDYFGISYSRTFSGQWAPADPQYNWMFSWDGHNPFWSGPATLETFEIAGSNYYNSLWGYQNGKVRNSNISRTHRPMLMLSHIFNMGPGSKLTTSLFYSFGKNGLTGLNWNDAPNPRPDYYRYLPSYYYMLGDTANGDILKYNWENKVGSTQQIDLDRLIRMNQDNLYTLPSQLGQGINTTETRARYILENKIEDLKNYGFNTVFNKRIKDLFVSIGVRAGGMSMAATEAGYMSAPDSAQN